MSTDATSLAKVPLGGGGFWEMVPLEDSASADRSLLRLPLGG